VTDTPLAQPIPAPDLEPPDATGGTAAAIAAPGADPGRFAGVSAIWIRELRGRMRGKRAFIFITIYLAILTGLFWAALQAGREFWTIGALESISFGRGIFAAVMFIETLVIVALAPAYTAGLISQEREKQTFDLLSVTPISSLSIILGKLLSGLSYLGLVVGASIPIASVAFLFGGIDVIDLVRGYTILVLRGDEPNPARHGVGVRHHGTARAGGDGFLDHPELASSGGWHATATAAGGAPVPESIRGHGRRQLPGNGFDMLRRRQPCATGARSVRQRRSDRPSAGWGRPGRAAGTGWHAGRRGIRSGRSRVPAARLGSRRRLLAEDRHHLSAADTARDLRRRAVRLADEAMALAGEIAPASARSRADR